MTSRHSLASSGSVTVPNVLLMCRSASNAPAFTRACTHSGKRDRACGAAQHSTAQHSAAHEQHMSSVQLKHKHKQHSATYTDQRQHGPGHIDVVGVRFERRQRRLNDATLGQVHGVFLARTELGQTRHGRSHHLLIRSVLRQNAVTHHTPHTTHHTTPRITAHPTHEQCSESPHLKHNPQTQPNKDAGVHT